MIFIRWWQEIVYTSLKIKGQTKINTLLSFIFQNALLISEVNDIHLRGTSISKQQLRLFIVRVKSILFTNNLTNYVQWVSESIIRYRPLRFTFTVAWRKPSHKVRVSWFFIQCSSSDHHKVFSFEKQSHMYKQIHNLNPVYIKYMNLWNLFLFFIVFWKRRQVIIFFYTFYALMIWLTCWLDSMIF